MKSLLMAAAACGALALAMPVLAQEMPPPANPSFGAFGFDATGVDRAVKPGDDFFRFADGGWVRRTAIPADKTSYGAFDLLFDRSEAQNREILEAAAAKNDSKIGAAWRAFMDEAAIERRGLSPLQPAFAAIRAADTHAKLAALMGRAPHSVFASVLDLGIEADAKDPTKYNVYLSQGGLGLPDRDYYLTPGFAAKKQAYQAYVATMLRLAGWAEPNERAAEIVALETRIAEVSWSHAEQRDPIKAYQPTTLVALEQASPAFPWANFLREAELGGTTTIVSATSTSIPKIAAIFEATPVATLQAWEAFHVVDGSGALLPKAFVDARFQFRNKTLQGQAEIAPRWKRGVRSVNGLMGDAIGEIYVAKYFPPESKAKMDRLIGDLKTAFAKHIEALDWMSPATKQQALAKLANYDVQVGYPKKWRDYSGLEIRADDAFGNAERSGAFEWAYRVHRLHAPVDKDEWLMSPQTVNAYNNPFFNEVVFPAAILQPPFFNPNADPAINYGAIGGVIGHEMTHGFDDEGRHFDSQGRLRDWWTAEDSARFEAKAKVLGAQYSAMEPLPGAHIKGDVTMGENIADLGGLTMGLEAYHASLHGQPAPVIDGLTGDQRVFYGWAQVWREKLREDALRQQIVANEHSPPEARVNGVVHNLDAWYSAFDVKPGDKLYLAPDQRVRIW